MAVHMGQELFIPWRFSPSGLARCLSTKLPGALLVKLLDCLCTRDFRPLHSDPTLLHAMSTQCLFCGGTFAPAALRDHVHSQHAASGDLVFDLMSQLVPCFSMLAVNDHTCPACKQIFNLPCPDDAAPEVLNDRQQLAQLHLLHQCPAVTQLAYLLADGACRRSDAANPRGRGDVRGLRPDEQCMGNVSEVSRGRKRQQETQKDTTARNTSRRRASSTAASGHGLTDAEVGCGAAVDEKARLLNMLLANRSTSAPSHAGSPSYLLESTKGAAERVGQYSTGASTLAQPLVPDHGQDPPRSADTIGVIGTSGCYDVDSDEDWHAELRGTVPLPAMESSTTEAPGDNTASDLHASHGQVLRAASGVGTGSELHHEVPVTQAGRHSPGDPLVVAGLNETGRPSMLTPSTTREHGMEPPGHAVEAAHLTSEQASHAPENSPGQGLSQGQVLGEGTHVKREEVESPSTPSDDRLLSCFEGLRLANIDNWCFINSAFLATTWALLCSHSFTLDSWGPHASQLVRFFMQSPSSIPRHLIDIPCFQPLLASWTSNDGQGDPVEFIAHLLRGLEFQDYDMRWETRVQIGSLTHIHDQNKDACNPLVLQFDPAHLDNQSIHIRQMLMDWSNQHGRQVGLLSAPALICLQIDRCVDAGDGRIQKKDLAGHVHGGCEIPVFAGVDLRIVWHEYHVVAQVAHLGQDNAGHCRSMLITAPTMHGSERTLALLTEDWLHPSRICKAPYWFSRNVTCLWLCRSDCLNLYQVPAFQPVPADDHGMPEPCSILMQS